MFIWNLGPVKLVLMQTKGHVPHVVWLHWVVCGILVAGWRSLERTSMSRMLVSRLYAISGGWLKISATSERDSKTPTGLEDFAYTVSGVVVHKTDDWSLFGYSGFSIHPVGYMELEAFFLFQGRNPPPPPRVPSPLTFLSVSLLCRLRFTSHNIHYISPITRHCHANILPSTGQENNIAQPKTDKWFSSPSQFSTFFII